MKRGFTLIELMAVIIILGIVGMISVIAVDKVIKDNKGSLYNNQVVNIENAAKTWGTKHIKYLPENKDEAISIPLLVLKQDGILTKDIKDPRTEDLFYNNMYIDISYENGAYVYNLIENSGTPSSGETDLDYPSIILKEKYNFSSYPNTVDVYLVKRDRTIITGSLTSTNDPATNTSTLTYTDASKTFTAVRKLTQ